MAGGLDTGISDAWLPALPGGWEIDSLRWHAWIRARLGWKGLTADEYVDEGVPMLSTPDIKAPKINFSGANRITVERYDESPEIKLRVGDVLLTKDGATIGIVNVVHHLPEPATVNGSIAVITASSNLEPRFLAYVLGSVYARQLMLLLQGGMGVPHLFQADIKRMRLPVPPRAEQQAIADFLDRETAKIDALIEKQDELVSILRERLAAKILHGTRPNPEPESGHGWRRVQLRRVALMSTGSTPTGDHAELFDAVAGLGWVTPEDLSPDVQPWRFLTSEGGAQLRRIPPGSSLVCGIGATVGKVGYTTMHVATNQQITALIPKRNLLGRYLYYALVAERAQILGLSVGNTLPIINNSRLAQVCVWIPDEASQDQIARQLQRETAKIDGLIGRAVDLVALAKERRAALITAAVTGQVDVLGEAS